MSVLRRQVEDIEKDLDQSSGNASSVSTSSGSGSYERGVYKILKIYTAMMASRRDLLNEMKQKKISDEDINKIDSVFRATVEKIQKRSNQIGKGVQTESVMSRLSIKNDLKSDLEGERVDLQAIKLIFEKIKDIESKIE